MFRILSIPLLLLSAGMPGAVLAEAQLPAAILQVPESVTTVFVAETATAEFHRFDRVGGALSHSETYYMSIGKAGPGKRRAGDRRTPLGAYFVTEQLDTSRLHEKYGVTAFPLDYPNAWDRLADRTGDGIWLHGVDPNGGRRPALDTDGCIALPNEDLLILVPDVKAHVTPVLVTENVAWRAPGEVDPLLAELRGQLDRWVESHASGNLFDYLSLYDESFQRWGLNKDAWSSLRAGTVSDMPNTGSTISEVMLLKYPGEDDLFLSRFQLREVGKEQSTHANKRLYWRRADDGTLKIVAESEG